MSLSRIWVCTAKSGKLQNIYLIQTDQPGRDAIYNHFRDSLVSGKEHESDMKPLSGGTLIDDIPYYVDVENINQESYLAPLQEKITQICSEHPSNILTFRKKVFKAGEPNFLEQNETVKFIIAQTQEELFFLSTVYAGIMTNKLIMGITSINQEATFFDIPAGIPIPSTVTARYENGKVYVYDVNRFESMLGLNEHKKAKSKDVIEKFKKAEYKLAEEAYTVKGLDQAEVIKELEDSARAVRRLAKYNSDVPHYPVEKIKAAVNRLSEDLRVSFDDDSKTVSITVQNAKTFVAILHNGIIQRLISGEIDTLM